MKIDVEHINSSDRLELAYDIREKVYIQEQQIERADEFDEFDETSQHFLALVDDTPAGTCRYRQTDEGIKLERFATLPEFRGLGVASRLMQAVLGHIKQTKAKVKLYLNAQLTAMPLYAKFGFKSEGDVFMECDIEHQKMSKANPT